MVANQLLLLYRLEKTKTKKKHKKIKIELHHEMDDQGKFGHMNRRRSTQPNIYPVYQPNNGGEMAGSSIYSIRPMWISDLLVQREPQSNGCHHYLRYTCHHAKHIDR